MNDIYKRVWDKFQTEARCRIITTERPDNNFFIRKWIGSLDDNNAASPFIPRYNYLADAVETMSKDEIRQSLLKQVEILDMPAEKLKLLIADNLGDDCKKLASDVWQEIEEAATKKKDVELLNKL